MEPVLSHFTLFHFIRPWFLLTLIPAIILFTLLWFRKPNFGSWQHVISPHLLPHLLQGSVKRQGKLPLVLLLIGWILASIALAGPTWSKLPQTVQKKINAKVILLDLSLSMLAQDLKPSRLTRAQHKLSDILNQSEEGLTGLVSYAGTSHVVSPLTDDTHTILSMVNSLTPEIMPIKGSNPLAAVQKATELMQQAGVNEGQILLITDDVPADFVGKVKQLINPTLTPISIFAIGTTEGAPIPLSQGSFVKDQSGAIVVPKLNTQRLKAAAKTLNGRFSTLSSDDGDINYLLGNSNRLLNDEMKDTDRDFDTWNEQGLFLVALLLPLAAIAYRKGWLSLFLLPTLLPTMLSSILLTAIAPLNAEANAWDDLWSTKDQQGQKAWRNENPQEASELFKNPEWKASAQYKSGDYQASAETLKEHISTDEGNTADNHYNLGNALAKQQDFSGALDAYEQALKLDPELEDAKSNQSLVKKLKEQQQEQQGDGDNKDNEQQDGEDSENKNQNQNDQDNNQENDEQQKQSDSESDDSEQQSQNNSDQQNDQEQKQDQSQQSQSEKDEESDKEQAASQDEQDRQEEQKQSQPQEPSEEKGDESEQQPTAMDIQESNLNKEDQQALEQWLRRIPDDPGGLLRRKFSQESKLRRNQQVEDKQW